MPWLLRTHMPYPFTQFLYASILLFACSFTSGAEPGKPLNPTPNVPADFLSRWLPWEAAHDLQMAILDETPEDSNPPEVTPFARIKSQLTVSPGKGKFTDVDELGDLTSVYEESSTKQRAEIHRLLADYIANLRRLGTSGNAPANLSWHGVACTALFQSVSPERCSERRKERGVLTATGSLLWKIDSPDSSDSFELRTSPGKLLIVHNDTWKLYDLRLRKWRNLPFSKSKSDDDDSIRYSIDDDTLRFLGRAYSLSSGQSVAAPIGPGMPVYLSDPEKVGAEWMTLYINPPHYNEETAGLRSKTGPEIEVLRDSLRDRFYFRSDDGTQRSLPMNERVSNYFVTATGRLCSVIGAERQHSFRWAFDESLHLAETAENRSLKEVMKGAFNGTWSVWNDGSKNDRMLLEQRFDYATSVPVRAATWEPQTKQWELLWNTDSPQMPPPPPGVMVAALAQRSRWELPRELTHPPVGTLVHCAGVISEKDTAFLLSESRDYVVGHHSVQLWVFKPGKRTPDKVALVLPGFRPASKFIDYGTDIDALQIKMVETGFIITDERSVWTLEWDFEHGIPKRPATALK